MRILLLHSDFMEYEPINKEIDKAEIDVEKSLVRIEDLIVGFISVESNDDGFVIDKACNEIIRYARSIKCDQLLLYPYSHLSSDLASSDIALDSIKLLEHKVRGAGLFKKVQRAPFGWTKSFTIKVKGHPLAENSRIITRDLILEKPLEQTTSESAALKAENIIKSSWYILYPEGNLVPYEKHSFRSEQKNLKSLFNYEISKRRTVDQIPPHVVMMKRLAIADYEPASDLGNLRYYPKGRLMKSLIESYVTRKVMEYGGIEVETPIMYDVKHPSMQSYFNRFPARQYNILSDNKELFLRFAACFGHFLMVKDFQISYKQLPLKLYELTRYSFRREKSGELVGLRRLRAFSMPDCHAFCKDIVQAKDEFDKRFDLSLEVIIELGLSMDDIEMAIRFTRDFYNNNEDFIKQIIKKFNKPVLVEIWDERFFYFILKWEFNFIDNLGKAAALSTDQIDVENGERYCIEFVDEDGTKKHPIILHNSPSGAIERVMYALLEKAMKKSQTGGVPYLPLWLSHTQVRIISVAIKHLEFCEELLRHISNHQIRADLDDRDISVGKKIRDSEMEWIHYTLVIGDKEFDGSRLMLRDRVCKKQYLITLEQIVEIVKSQLTNKPYLPLNLPLHLSKRPQIMV